MGTHVNTEVLKKQTSAAEGVTLTAAEQRLLRLFRAAPEEERPSLFVLMETVFTGCGWIADAKMQLHVVAKEVDTQDQALANDNAKRPIDVIRLFGSKQLIRAEDNRTWIFASRTTQPERLTMRESMFINAALRAAEVR